jgi:tRNA U55 pseudouridine synthase TruB
MTKLRRTKIDGFSEEECVSLQELNRKDVIPLESVLERIGLKRVAVKKESLGRIRNGMPVRAEDIIEREKLAENEHVGIYHGSEIVALGIVRDARAPVIKTDRVFK